MPSSTSIIGNKTGGVNRNHRTPDTERPLGSEEKVKTPKVGGTEITRMADQEDLNAPWSVSANTDRSTGLGSRIRINAAKDASATL